MPEAMLKTLGFESENELNQMVSSVDLSNPVVMKAFLEWKKNDGSKAGLEKVLEVG